MPTRVSPASSRTTLVGVREFWELNYGELQATFPEQLGGINTETFWRAINRVEPGLIRVESDELTYDFHIMLPGGDRGGPHRR